MAEQHPGAINNHSTGKNGCSSGKISLKRLETTILLKQIKLSTMETANNSRAYEKPVRANTEMYVRYQDIKTHLLLYLFIAVEWITGPVKNKESSYTTGIGLS